MFCKKMSDFKSWGGQFNTMSPPIKKLGGTCPQCPPPPCYAPDKPKGPSIIFVLHMFIQCLMVI